jgi:hypothetical protein
MKSEFIKKPNVVEEYTLEQVMELKKCAEDPVYFMKTYMKVMHPTRGSIPFDPYPYQVRAVETFKENKDSIVLMSRQMGKCIHRSTIVTLARRPTGFRRFLLRLFFKAQYDALFA